MGNIRKFVTIVVFFLPMLIYYSSPFLVSNLVSLIEIVLLFLIGLVCALQHKSFSLHYIKEYLALIVWMILISLIMIIFAPYNVLYLGNLNSFIFTAGIFFPLMFLGLLGIFDFEFGIRIYTTLVKILSLFLFIQVFCFYLVNFPLDFKIPFLELNEQYFDIFQQLSLKSQLGISPRFSSFFSEPSHYAQYVLPFLCMKLFGYMNLVKKNIFHATIITACVLLGLSGNGIIAATITWSYYFFMQSNKNNVKKIMLIIIGLFSIIALYAFLMQFNIFSNMITTMFVNSASGSSKADYRIYRGLYVYLDMPLIYQLIGTGYKNGTAVINHYGISTPFDLDGVTTEYFSTIFQISIYSGIIGLVLYLLMMKAFFKNTDVCGKSLVIVFFLFNISSSIFMDETWLLYMFLIFAGKDQSIINQRINKQI